MSSNDVALIDAAIDGDQSAYTRLYEDHYPKIFRTLLQQTHNAEDAEDLTQQTFIAAFRGLARFRKDAQFGTWLHRIAINQFLMKRRRKANAVIDSLDDPIGEEGNDTLGSQIGASDENLEAVADRDILSRCIALLPPGQRRVVLLHTEGYSHADIGEQLGFTEGASKSQYHHAKRALRDLMQGKRPLPIAKTCSVFTRPKSHLAVSVTVEEITAISQGSFNGRNKCRFIECSNLVKFGRTFCSVSCACKFTARNRRKIDPKQVELLNKTLWLSRDEQAKRLGVTRHGINNVISRHRLGRLRPAICRVRGCGQPTHKIRHVRGYLTGTLCLHHYNKRQSAYVRASRRRLGRVKDLSPEQRSEHARKASLARWAGTTPEERKAFTDSIRKARDTICIAECNTSAPYIEQCIANVYTTLGLIGHEN